MAYAFLFGMCDTTEILDRRPEAVVSEEAAWGQIAIDHRESVSVNTSDQSAVSACTRASSPSSIHAYFKPDYNLSSIRCPDVILDARWPSAVPQSVIGDLRPFVVVYNETTGDVAYFDDVIVDMQE